MLDSLHFIRPSQKGPTYTKKGMQVVVSLGRRLPYGWAAPSSWALWPECPAPSIATISSADSSLLAMHSPALPKAVVRIRETASLPPVSIPLVVQRLLISGGQPTLLPRPSGPLRLSLGELNRCARRGHHDELLCPTMLLELCRSTCRHHLLPLNRCRADGLLRRMKLGVFLHIISPICCKQRIKHIMW
jgi:hypothetical protein